MTYKSHTLKIIQPEFYPGLHQAKLKTVKGNRLSSDILEKIIKMPLHERYFNDYKIKTIESCPIRNKEIVFPTFDTENSEIDFNVEEDIAGIYLIKK